jgi:phosphoserine aminotransferase
MSSNILSRRVPVDEHSIIFFGAQKNLGTPGVTVAIIKKVFLPPTCSQPAPTIMRKLGLPVPPIILQYQEIAKNNSLYNTLSIFEYVTLHTPQTHPHLTPKQRIRRRPSPKETPENLPR